MTWNWLTYLTYFQVVNPNQNLFAHDCCYWSPHAATIPQPETVALQAPHMDAKATFSIGMRLRRTDKALIFEATGAFVHREERLRCGELIREKKEKWLWLRLKCKVTVGVKVHLKQMWWPQTNALSLSLLSDSSFFNGGVRTILPTWVRPCV